jgi:sulfatase modifying factor 1
MKKGNFIAAVLWSIILLDLQSVYAQNIIDVVVEGISDGVKNTKQIDRDEAIMDAKLKAIERAGVDVTSVTTIENFQLKKDWIESKASASILPGFQIVETGYGTDRLYHMVLSCKVTSSKSAQTNDNPAGIEWVFVKSGTFQMGDTFGDGDPDERPVHTVTVSDFHIGKTEVTVAQYRTFCNATGRTMPSAPSWGWKDKNPIVNVSWDDAEAFCEWAECRLPTEAEWEYAAKGGNKGRGYKFSGSNVVDDVAWYTNNSGSTTHQVGTKKANELGLFDMSGNVVEWCSDWYDFYQINQSTNLQEPPSDTFRVLRGGSWNNTSRDVSCTGRCGYLPNGRLNSDGFRCAK